ncbi:MAG: GTPase RsgA, partial [Bacteroidales bacterium]|nr:GTPase RsgA [Bacteroidales bacterium]
MKKGIVIKSTGSWYYIKNKEGVVVPCKIKGTYRIKGIRATNPVAVGDFVIYRILQNEQTGVIEQIHTRKNYIIRRSPKLSKEYQLIAANIDQAVLMITLIRPKTMYEFIDRFLVSAEAFRIPVLLLFNKTDIYDESTLQEMKELISTYEQTGYQCLDASLKNQINIDLIVEHLTNKTS